MLAESGQERGVLMKVGDLVVRTYGEGQHQGIVVGFGYMPSIAKVIWLGIDGIDQFAISHLEIVSESR